MAFASVKVKLILESDPRLINICTYVSVAIGFNKYPVGMFACVIPGPL